MVLRTSGLSLLLMITVIAVRETLKALARELLLRREERYWNGNSPLTGSIKPSCP